MRNLYNLGWGLALCSLLGACQSDGIPEVEAGSTLELRSVSLADDAVTKAVTTSVDNVKLYLKNSSDTWVNPVYSKSGVTWGCESVHCWVVPLRMCMLIILRKKKVRPLT